MKSKTMNSQDKLKQLAIAFLEAGASFEYPGFVMIPHQGGYYCVGDANGDFGIDYTGPTNRTEPVVFQEDPRGEEIAVWLPLEAEADELIAWVSLILTQRAELSK